MKVTMVLLLCVTVVLTVSCGAVDEVLRDTIQKPAVSFQSADLESLSFSRADLLFSLRIDNPNPVGIRLAGFDYDFRIDDASFIRGEQTEGLDIASRGSSTVTIPVSVGYEELFTSFAHLLDRDRSTYRIDCGFRFDLPVLGDVRVPVSREGDLPVLRLPGIRFGALRVSRLTLTRADLDLELMLDNPNDLVVSLTGLKYDLFVNDSRWAGGETGKAAEVGPHGEGRLVIPLSLELARIGTDAYVLLSEGREVNYRIEGVYLFTTSMPLIGQTDGGFDLRGITGF